MMIIGEGIEHEELLAMIQDNIIEYDERSGLRVGDKVWLTKTFDNSPPDWYRRPHEITEMLRVPLSDNGGYCVSVTLKDIPYMLIEEDVSNEMR